MLQMQGGVEKRTRSVLLVDEGSFSYSNAAGVVFYRLSSSFITASFVITDAT